MSARPYRVLSARPSLACEPFLDRASYLAFYDFVRWSGAEPGECSIQIGALSSPDWSQRMAGGGSPACHSVLAANTTGGEGIG